MPKAVILAASDTGQKTAVRKPAGKVKKTPPPVKTNKSAKRRHKVRQGDTLWNIARHYSTSVSVLLRLNGLSPESLLKVGSRLLVP